MTENSLTYELLNFYKAHFEMVFEYGLNPFQFVEKDWFRVEYPFKYGRTTQIDLSVFAEIHIFYRDESPFITGQFGFHCDGQLFYGATDDAIISSDFIVEKGISSGVTFYYKKYGNSSFVLNLSGNPRFEIADFINRLCVCLNSDYYLDFVQQLNNYRVSSKKYFQGGVFISEQYLKSLVPEVTFNKALYYSSNRVTDIGWDDNLLLGKVKGHDGNVYNVRVKCADNRILSHFCTCKAHSTYVGPCKHVLALILLSNKILC